MLSIKEIEIKYNITFIDFFFENYYKEILNIFNHNIKEYKNNKDAHIFFILGSYHQEIKKDYIEMEKYYLKAIQDKNVNVMVNLCYYHQEITKNYSEMEKNILMAIEHKDTNAMIFLAQYHQDISKNYPEMEKYYLMAIEHNDSDAMCNLAQYHQDITKNYFEMEKYYLMAIRMNDSYAMCNLINYYLTNNKKLDFILDLDIDLKFNIETDSKKNILNCYKNPKLDERIQKLYDKVINKEEFKIHKPDFNLIFHFENSVEIYKIHSIVLNYRYF